MIKKESINNTTCFLSLVCCYPCDIEQALILEKVDGFHLLLEKCGEADSAPYSMPLAQGPFTAPLSIKMKVKGLKSRMASGGTRIMQFHFWVFCPLSSEIIAS